MDTPTLPEKIKYVLNTLQSHGYEAFVVGGCVRDALIFKHKKINNYSSQTIDYDVTTNAKPHEVETVFRDHKIVETGIKHGTVTVIIEGFPCEITTYRTDGEYKDCRRPEAVIFTASLEEDLKRRDFTINTIAYNEQRGLVDLYGGIDDIKNGIIRCVGNPEDRFAEDALRIFRGVRFASVLGFSIEHKTFDAMNKLSCNLPMVSGERTYTELTKMLNGKNILEVLLSSPDIIGWAVKEISPCIGFKQHNPHHVYNVYEHTAHAVSLCENDIALRLAALFHDSGKPHTFTTDSAGIGHFKGHASVSLELADAALSRMNASNLIRNEVTTLIKYHDAIINDNEVSVKKWISKLGNATFKKLISLKIADNCAQNRYFDRMPSYRHILEIAHQIENTSPALSLKDLKINGNDLKALGFFGKEIGYVLNTLLNEVLENVLINERNNLINRAKKIKN